ncbi:MAG: oxidoreductase [Gammaproteobacteria bacterium]|nr:oxidoreductase [Gammaproteobacteria bacterium]
MKMLVRTIAGLVVAVALAGVGIALFAPISIPWRGPLSEAFPSLVDAPTAERDVVESSLEVPAGYSISLFASDVPDARMLRVTAAGDVLVVSTRRGEITWLGADRDGDGVADARRVLLTDLDGPNGIDIADGFLYIAENRRVVRVAFDAATGTVDGAPQVIIDNLPTGGNHWRKPIRFGPDGLLYMVIGSTCNVCIEADERRATMLRYTKNGEYLGIYATGLRNSAGFDWRPADGQLYATDNGRDLLGDDFPPCELNQIREGGFYGWPFANGNRIADPDLGEGRQDVIAASIPPVFEFRAHNAPLGIVFLRSERHGPHRGAAVVALHGSWNRTQKDGYKVVSLHWGADGSIESRDFISGFLDNGTVRGRPAEVAEDAAGNVYVSDDYAHAVYRVTPGGTALALDLSERTTVAFSPRIGADPARLIEGQALFDNGACLECHSVEAAPSDGRLSLSGVGERYDLVALVDYLEHPRAPMPPVASGHEREALAEYLLAL